MTKTATKTTDQGQLFPISLDQRADGPGLNQADHVRLAKQLHRVWAYMMTKQNTWVTLREASEHLGIPEASLSARLRDLRKPRYGSNHVSRRRSRIDGGSWVYKMTPNARVTVDAITPRAEGGKA